ncbi:hypothetical protein LFZ31_22170, partial [Salmonella enterica subsp. enterica serovar Newport str. S09097]
MHLLHLNNIEGNFMKAVILAGGLGTRLSEETIVKPKPNGRNWWQAYSLAHYENVFCAWYQGFLLSAVVIKDM